MPNGRRTPAEIATEAIARQRANAEAAAKLARELAAEREREETAEAVQIATESAPGAVR